MKNILIGVLVVVSAGSLIFAYLEKSEAKRMANELIESEIKAQEFQKMYDQAITEMQVQRVICEEQLSALKSK